MSEEQAAVVQQESRQRGMPGLSWAIILIAVGAVALLNNLHIAGFGINWFALARFWPVILILIGLDILVGRRSMIGSVAVALVSLAVLAGVIWMVGFNSGGATTFGNTVTKAVSQPLGDVKAARVTFNLGAGETRVKAQHGGGNLVEGTYTTNQDLPIKLDYTVDGSTGILTIKQQNTNRNVDVFNSFVGLLDLKLADSVPVDLVVDAGVGQVTFDLTGINLHSLNIDSGVGNVEITLPASGQYTVDAQAGVGQLQLHVPKSLEASIVYEGGISNINLPQRYVEKGRHTYVTAGYTDAANRATMNLDTGVGNVEIIDQ